MKGQNMRMTNHQNHKKKRQTAKKNAKYLVPSPAMIFNDALPMTDKTSKRNRA